MSKLTWEIIGTSLQLTVKDGSKTSVWTLRKSASGTALGAKLRAVQEALVPQVGSASAGLSTARSEPFVSESVKRRIELTEEPLEITENLIGQVDSSSTKPKGHSTNENEPTDQAILQDAVSEGQSLEQLKDLAWRLASRGAGFIRGEVPDDLARQVNAQPEYNQKGVNPGFPTFDVNPVENKMYREKPQYNIDNHED